jgi:hypothetical protein
MTQLGQRGVGRRGMSCNGCSKGAAVTRDRGEDEEERLGFVGAYWVSVGPGVLRVWDHFCAPKSGDVGFLLGKVGLDFFIFGWRGVARKGS